jgi:hypothetical protein
MIWIYIELTLGIFYNQNKVCCSMIFLNIIKNTSF